MPSRRRSDAEGYRRYSVSVHHKQPLLEFIVEALEACGCAIINSSPPSRAPFKISFQDPTGARHGIIAYAFFANSKRTKNRPDDEWRFQVKYGSKRKYRKHLHEVWQDPYGLYTTLFLGINPEQRLFVGADPVLNSPTRFFISKEFKDENVQEILKDGWAWWEREAKGSSQEPVEVLVGGRSDTFLRYVMFEKEARGEDQGHRGLLAEKFTEGIPTVLASAFQLRDDLGRLDRDSKRLHALEVEFELDRANLLDLISRAPRLKMAVRGWVAEEHLFQALKTLPDVSECVRIEEDGKPDLALRFRRRGPYYIECKNVLRKPDRHGHAKVDFQRTRAAKGNPCSRYYERDEFHVLAACLHAVTEEWRFAARPTAHMDEHPKCEGRLDHLVRVDGGWSEDLYSVLETVV